MRKLAQITITTALALAAIAFVLAAAVVSARATEPALPRPAQQKDESCSAYPDDPICIRVYGERKDIALPRHLSGVWCYNKIASEDAIEEVDIYDRAKNIPACANRGGFTIWPNGRGWTFGRFEVVRNSCKFERVYLIKSSGKRKTYRARIACDNSGEDADDPEDNEIKYIDLMIRYNGKGRLINSLWKTMR